MIPLFVNFAAAAVTAVLTVSSARNMMQTLHLSRLDAHRNTVNYATLFQPSDSTETIVAKIQAMKRKDLLQLYFSSSGPTSVSQIEGEWDGILLDNNSWVMTSVTALLTDRLFGMGRKWNGKQFGLSASNNDNDNDYQESDVTINQKLQGVNRFFPRQRRQQHSQSATAATTSVMHKQHKFDMRIQTTKLGAKNNSLVLDYTHHQSPLSLWRAMMDEIRIVPTDDQEDPDANRNSRVLIGLGYMAWSGGRLNSSPFVLYRKTRASMSFGSKNMDATSAL